jgi:hypothetical protein
MDRSRPAHCVGKRCNRDEVGSAASATDFIALAASVLPVFSGLLGSSTGVKRSHSLEVDIHDRSWTRHRLGKPRLS